MIDNQDLSEIKEGYDALLASTAAKVGNLQRPDRTRDSTGAANAGGWATVMAGIRMFIEELSSRQTESFQLRNDSEVKEGAYALIFGAGLGAQSGDRIIIGADPPYYVRSVNTGLSAAFLTEAVCIQSRRLSDRV